MRLAGSRRRWTGCRKNARGSDARVDAPGLGIEPDWRPARQRRRVRLGFLGRGLFRFENPRFRGLDCLVFSWILSSESRLINGLRGKNRRRNFLTALPLAFAAPEGTAAFEAMRKRRSVHRAELNLDSDFLQSFVAPAVSPSRLDHKQLGLGQTSISRTGFEPKQTDRLA
jgi:hypothetical protein